jgi:RNA polymerase sigma-70 factor (ECF subfamily)
MRLRAARVQRPLISAIRPTALAGCDVGAPAACQYRAVVPAPSEKQDPTSDALLVARMARGDRSAVAALYDRHARALLGLARGLLRSQQEAEDLIHDVFLEAWQRSADYSEARGSVRTWLLLRTRCRALDRLKSAGRPRVVFTESAAEAVEAGSLPLGTGDQQRLRALLEQMPEGQRQVIALGYFEGLSTTEIANRLGIPAGTVKSRTRAALLSLRTVLGDENA